ncbi:hypothetical protein AMPC_22140 [Anaeromyxobacter paludicola]|uniref:Uncharacterized protein n=1 Tax=Anaeromyxobacter paludicola TaxID=2918171 RepID=A0ABM7XB74_9BACT|nr:hypothetical protein AMPC_22140 [Anaeromyxobacter paludicola]
MGVLALVACLVICRASRAQVTTSQRLDFRVRRDPLRHLLSYGLVGGLTGAAIGGGVLGLLGTAGPAQPDVLSVIATSAGIGFAVGMIWSIVESEPHAPALALRPPRDGLSFSDLHPGERSGTVLLPIFGQRF